MLQSNIENQRCLWFFQLWKCHQQHCWGLQPLPMQGHCLGVLDSTVRSPQQRSDSSPAQLSGSRIRPLQRILKNPQTQISPLFPFKNKHEFGEEKTQSLTTFCYSMIAVSLCAHPHHRSW